MKDGCLFLIANENVMSEFWLVSDVCLTHFNMDPYPLHSHKAQKYIRCYMLVNVFSMEASRYPRKELYYQLRK